VQCSGSKFAIFATGIITIGAQQPTHFIDMPVIRSDGIDNSKVL
jgi:hypothetical protein